MRFRDSLIACILLAITLALLLLGLFFLTVPYIPDWYHVYIQLVSRSPQELFSFALYAISAAIIAFICLSFLFRKQVLTVKMGDNRLQVKVSPKALQQYCREVIKQLYPNEKIKSYLELQQGKICLVADLSKVQGHSSSSILANVEKEMQTRLTEHFGYNQPFFFSVKVK